jgi:Cu/Ag efflux protein CusF
MSGMMAMSAGSPTAPCGQGTVVRVDASIGRVVIRHDEMESLGMPAMTTAFRVHDRSLLQDLHAGERIEFRVVPSDDGLIVTALTLNQ